MMLWRSAGNKTMNIKGYKRPPDSHDHHKQHYHDDNAPDVHIILRPLTDSTRRANSTPNIM